MMVSKRTALIALGCNLMVGCGFYGLTGKNDHANENAGGAGAAASDGGAPAATGGALAAAGAQSEGGSEAAGGHDSGAAGEGGSGGEPVYMDEPIVFTNHVGQLLADAPLSGFHASFFIDGSAPSADITVKSDHEVCATTVLHNADEDIEIWLRIKSDTAPSDDGSVPTFDAPAAHVTGFSFDLWSQLDPSQPDAPWTDFSVGALYYPGSIWFEGAVEFEPKHNQFAFGDLTSRNDVELTPDVQAGITSLFWSVNGSNVETPVTFCIKNLVALRQ